VANGGFTLMGEAVYLRKPMLSEPVGKQFEQVLNARYLQSLGYGLHAEAITAGALSAFIERLPDYEQALAAYSQDGNRDLLRKLDQVLEAARHGPPPLDLDDPTVA
jgi:UDP:flavonoid glycosyltransferase YjiC (YdhE family)